MPVIGISSSSFSFIHLHCLSFFAVEQLFCPVLLFCCCNTDISVIIIKVVVVVSKLPNWRLVAAAAVKTVPNDANDIGSQNGREKERENNAH